jgi:superfamily II DNA/RNA helicase
MMMNCFCSSSRRISILSLFFLLKIVVPLEGFEIGTLSTVSVLRSNRHNNNNNIIHPKKYLPSTQQQQQRDDDGWKLHVQAKEQSAVFEETNDDDDDGNSIVDGDDDEGSLLEYDATLGTKTFRDLYSGWLPDWLLDRCEASGWTHPTLIQRRVLKASMECSNNNKNNNNNSKNSMVIQAHTGSGKTLTYLLPILAQLEERAAIQALIVVPTRELGLQVATVTKRLLPPNMMAMSLLQGSMLKRQRAWAWAETPQVVIGTPNEVFQMIQHGGLPRINGLKYVVVDEVDACLGQHSSFSSNGPAAMASASASSSDPSMTSSPLHLLLSKHLSPTHNENNENDDDYETMNNLPTTRQERRKQRKQRRVSSQRQTIFCSATIPQHRHFLKQCQANQWTLEQPLFISTSSPGQALPPTLDHAYLVCQSKDKKLAALRRVLKKIHGNKNKNDDDDSPSKILIFGDPTRPLEEMAMAIAHDVEGIYFQEKKQRELVTDKTSSPVVSVLRYEDSLTQRAGATNVFARPDESLRVMLTTDLAARGLDIVGITHVIHFDLPPNAETYLHRSGRTGRLGESGQVLSIITTDQEFVLQRLSNALNLETKCIGRQKRSKA